MNKRDTEAATALIMGMMGGFPPASAFLKSGYPLRRREEKPMSYCLLPGCDVMTSHNGGYCSAGHCREHRRLRKIGGRIV